MGNLRPYPNLRLDALRTPQRRKKRNVSTAKRSVLFRHRKYTQNDKDFARSLFLGAYECRICHQFDIVCLVLLLFLSMGKCKERSVRLSENAGMSGKNALRPIS